MGVVDAAGAGVGVEGVGVGAAVEGVGVGVDGVGVGVDVETSSPADTRITSKTKLVSVTVICSLVTP